MTEEERARLILRLRALMARTVANGCTEDEELTAAAMVCRVVAQLAGVAAPAAGAVRPRGASEPPPSWARRERDSAGYQSLLEKATVEGLLKAAVQELALDHINAVSPPGRERGHAVEWVPAHELLEPHLAMMLGAGTKVGRDVLSEVISELVDESKLPQAVPIPRDHG